LGIWASLGKRTGDGRTSDISRDILANFTGILWYITPVTIILAGGLGLWLIMKMLKPLDAMSEAARGMNSRNPGYTIPVSGNDEIGGLATVLNEAFARMQKALEHERAVMDDASHELNAPLAVIQGEATLALKKSGNEADYRKTIDTICLEAANLSTLVNRLLLTSRLDSGGEQVVFCELNLKDILCDFAEDLNVLCEEKDIRFTLDATQDILVRGDRYKLRELILNLVDNAVKYTPVRGAIYVSLVSSDGHAVISVRDTGAGIAPEHLPRLFERFYRVDASIPGSGLGLAICRRIATLHGGRMEVESVFGKGSDFRLILPLLSLCSGPVEGHEQEQQAYEE